MLCTITMKSNKFKSKELIRAAELAAEMEDDKFYMLDGEDVPELFRGEILSGKMWKEILV